MKNQKLKIERLNMEADLAVEKNEDGDRIASLKWYTGSTIQRRGFDGSYKLRLSLEKDHVRMGRLKSGKAPLLNSHSDYKLADVIGVVTAAELDGSARVKFSNRPEVDGIWADVRDGIIRNASVGAAIYKLKDESKKDSEGNIIEKSLVAIDWEPLEVSLVPIGADADAGLCHEETEAEVVSDSITNASEKPRNKGEQMKVENEAGETARLELEKKARKDAEDLGIAEERLRVKQINECVRTLRLPQSFADEHIDKGSSIEVFRDVAINEAGRLAEREVQGSQNIVDPIQGTQRAVADPRRLDEQRTRRVALISAILEKEYAGKFSVDPRTLEIAYHRNGGQKMFEAGRQYVGMSTLDMAKYCLESVGVNWRALSKGQIVEAAFHSTSDFPYILADSANKTLRAGYDSAPSQWRLIADRRTAPDFKTNYELTFDNSSRLEEVKESAEFTRSALVEGRESWQVKTYGKIIAITRQAIINDNVGAFTRIPFMLGAEVNQKQADLLFALITGNVQLADGVALFSVATHANKVDSGDAIDIASLGETRFLMSQQTSPGGKTLGLVPAFLLAPATLGVLAEQYCSPAFQAVTSATINPFAGKLTPIVEPRLDASNDAAWYLFADPASPNGTVLIYGYLAGQEGPFTETREGFNVDAMEIKIRMDFGVGAIDYRGAVMNDGE